MYSAPHGNAAQSGGKSSATVSVNKYGEYYAQYSAQNTVAGQGMGSYTGYTSERINVTENKEYEIIGYINNSNTVPHYGDPSNPEPPTIESLMEYGLSEEEAQRAIEQWRVDRQEYLELEEQGLEKDQILAQMYSAGIEEPSSENNT